MEKISFIGLGHMGHPIAEGLKNVGNDILAFDIFPPARQSFSGKTTSNLSELAEHANIIITMLPSGVELLSIYAQKDFTQKLAKNTLLIDCSTIGPLAAQQFHNLPFNTIDAPVSGGVIAAQAQQLTYMLGGIEPYLSVAERLLTPISKKILRTGGPGSGQIAKTCNNLVLANTMIAISEAFLLAEKLGLKAQALYEVLKCSSGNCWVVEKYLPIPNIARDVPANNNYTAGFSNKMMLKDLLIAQAAAKSTDLSLSLTEQTINLYALLQTPEDANKDFSYIFDFLKHHQ